MTKRQTNLRSLLSRLCLVGVLGASAAGCDPGVPKSAPTEQELKAAPQPVAAPAPPGALDEGQKEKAGGHG